jgi:nicotinamidase-related amidase
MVLDRASALLVIVDLQQKLLPAIHDHEDLCRRAALLVRGIRLLGLPILVTEQYPQGLGTSDTLVQESLGDAYRPITKASMSAWDEPSFRQAFTTLRRHQVLLCGIEAHVCVYQTARDLLSRGQDVYLLADCVGSRRETDCRIGIQEMAARGCRLTTHEMAVFEMLRTSGTQEFKDWVQIIR